MTSRSQPPPSASDVSERFLEIADVMMIAIDATGEVTYTNAKARDILGYESGTLVGADWFDMCIPDRIQEEVHGVFDRLMTGELEADECHENAVVTADGKERTIEWHNTVLHDDEGRITGTLSSGQDVTERKEREAELERHELYLESVSDLVTVVEENGTIEYDSPAVTELLGYEPDERVGESAFDHIHPEDRDRIKERFQTRVVGSGTPQRVEYRTRRKDGTWIWVESRVRVFTDTTPVEGIIITTRDITDRKEREAELRQFKEMVQAMSHSVYITDADGTIEYVNPAFETTTGYTAEEAIGRTPRILKSGEHDEEFYEELWETILAGDTWEGELVNATKGGDRYVITQTISPVTDEAGEISNFVAVNTDITERKEQEHKRQQVIDRINDVVIEVDADWRCTLVSDEAEELVNVYEEEMLGRNVWEVFAGTRDTTFEKRYREVMNTREPVSFVEYDARREIWFDVQVYPNDDGGISIYFRDVTDRKERERDLRMKSQALEESPVGITIADANQPDKPIIYANEGVCNLTGYSRQRVLGDNCRFLQGEETDDSTVTEIREAIDSEKPIRTEILNYCAGGTPFWNKLTVAPITGTDAEDVTHFVGIQEDVTAEKRRDRLIEVLNRVLRHNLRNDMNAIQGFAEVIADRTEGEKAQMARQISKKAAELTALSEKARDFQTAVRNADPLAPRDVLADVEAVVAELRTEFPELEFTIEADSSEDVMATEDLRLALRELGANAAQHGESSPITYRVEMTDEDEIAVSVRDGGPGLPEVERKVLEAGHETPMEHGSGLGLWLVNWLVTGLGGEVTTTVDDGTTVTVRFSPADVGAMPEYRDAALSTRSE